MRHSCALMFLRLGAFGEGDCLLGVFCFVLGWVFPLVYSQHIPRESERRSQKYQHLQNWSDHPLLLSTSMPSQSKTAPTRNTSRKASQRCLFGSKSSYIGAKTRTRIPASRRASPPISAVLRFSDKITSVPGEEARYHSQHSPINRLTAIPDGNRSKNFAQSPYMVRYSRRRTLHVLK